MKDINYEMVGNRMRRLRKEQCYTQEQIAKDLGVTVAFISNLENNRVKMNLRIIRYYANLLNVSIDYLLQDETDEENRNVALDYEIMRLLRFYAATDKERLIKTLKVWR